MIAFCVVAGILVLLVLLGLYWLLPGKTDERHSAALAALRGRNVAHRGLHTQDKSVPENSLAAFEAACQGGYGIELDIQLSRDGEVVTFHDDDLKRVCGVDKRVDSVMLAELKELRIEGTEQTIPTFEETLAVVNGRAPLVVELKTGGRNRELCEKAYKLLSAYKGIYCIESFDPRIVGWFKRNHPGVLRGQLTAAPSHLKSGILGVAVGSLLTNALARPHFIAHHIGKTTFTARWAQKRAVRVAWTARPGDDVKKLEAENEAIIFEYYTPKPTYK